MLSAGQRQRIAVVRVMLKKPRLLILDEASSSLGAESERPMQDALERLMARCTTLAIAHRRSTVIRGGRILVLDHGRVEDRGLTGSRYNAGPGALSAAAQGGCRAGEPRHGPFSLGCGCSLRGDDLVTFREELPNANRMCQAVALTDLQQRPQIVRLEEDERQ